MYSSLNSFRPFCSARCKNHDFGAWASGAYAVDADTPARDSALGADSGSDEPTTH